MINPNDVTFGPVVEADYAEFSAIRHDVIREHVEALGLEWDEAEEEAYHRKIFDLGELRSILYKGERIGFLGLHEQDGCLNFSRFCLKRAYQSQGIGGIVFKRVLEEPELAGRTLYLDVLRLSPARRFYERFGFRCVKEDDILAYYEGVVGQVTQP